ncbi:MAG TPA: GGDEF domain-containing protein [Candidatus Angelobacter sp.]|nr:GGDEF domain-containing protein [Candidatus Angelobacter sp.]
MPLAVAVPAALLAFAAAALADPLGAAASTQRAVANAGVGALIVAGAVAAGRVRVARVAAFWGLVRIGLWLLAGAYLFSILDNLGVRGPWAVGGLVLLLGAYPFLFGALCRRAIREEGFEGGLATLIDVAILVCSLTVASIPLMVVPLAAEHSTISLASGITWASDVGLFAGGLWLLYRVPRGRDARSIALLVVALGAFSVLTLFEATLQIRSGPVVPWWLTALFGPPYALVALAPRLEPVEVPASRRDVAVQRWLSPRTLMPYLAFVPLTGLWFVSVGMGWDTRLVGSGIAVVSALVVGRQLLLLRDHHAVLVERARQALTDELTAVRNRRAFDEDLAQLLDIAGRRGAGLVVLMVDLDDLKRVNDSSGHLAGDRALVAVATALSAGARTSDRVYRLGGDEFAMLLPDAGGGGAERVLADARARLGRDAAWLSISAGLAAYPADARDAEGLLAVADRRLYRCKRGRPAALVSGDGAAGGAVAAAHRPAGELEAGHVVETAPAAAQRLLTSLGAQGDQGPHVLHGQPL